MIYLDHNSTTPLAAEAADAMAAWLGPRFGNPASQHAVGRRARQALESAREEIAEILGARLAGREADRLIFTSGGTEANNLALAGLTGALEPGAAAAELLISSVEHPSVTEPAEWLARHGWTLRRLGVDAQGLLDLPAACAAVGPATRLVSVMLANNETGVLQPLAELASACRERGVICHSDAAQAVGKVPVHFGALGLGALSLAAHKFHGPLGIGALLVRHDVPMRAQLLGGHQQLGARGGTESVALAVGMQAALVAWQREATARAERMTKLRDRLEAGLRAHSPETIVLGAIAARLPHTSCVALPGLDRQALVMALDLAGVACSSGSACASGSSEPSPVLLAMKCDERVVSSAVRFSLGATTTAAEIDEAVQRIGQVCQQMRRTASCT